MGEKSILNIFTLHKKLQSKIDFTIIFFFTHFSITLYSVHIWTARHFMLFWTFFYSAFVYLLYKIFDMVRICDWSSDSIPSNSLSIFVFIFKRFGKWFASFMFKNVAKNSVQMCFFRYLYLSLFKSNERIRWKIIIYN